jgi:small conductance mechanosensitive channel
MPGRPGEAPDGPAVDSTGPCPPANSHSVRPPARPFQVGDRLRFNGFGMDVEGTVAAHGLLHVTMYDGDDLVLVPNNTALSISARPIREPDAVDLRARLPVTVDPEAVQRRVDEAVSVSTKGPPDVALEGLLAHDVLGAVAAFEAERRTAA